MTSGEIVMLRCLLLVVAAISLSGCLTSGNSFQSPSGAIVNTAKCTNTDACFQKAAATCGGPYQVIESERQLYDSGNRILGSVVWYSMTYQCGPSDGKMPTFAFRDGPAVNTNVNQNITIHQQ
jgi:hypothetical protein